MYISIPQSRNKKSFAGGGVIQGKLIAIFYMNIIKISG